MTGALPLPAPEPSPAPHEKAALELAAAEREVAREIAALREFFAGCCPPHGQPPLTIMLALGRVADIEKVMLGQRKDLADAAVVQGFGNWLAAEAAAPAPVLPARRPASHRRSKRLRVVPGDDQPGLFGVAIAATAATVKGAWQAVPHHVAATVAAGTATTALAAGTVAAVLVPSSPLHLGGHPSAASPAPAASVFAATPITAGGLPGMPALGKHSGSQEASVNGQGWVFSPPPPVTAGPGSGPSSSQDPSQQGPPPPDPSSQAGDPAQIQMQGSLDLGSVGSAVLTVTATGSGWVSWSASSDTGGVSLSRDHGVLTAGQSATITVSVSSALQALAGPATVTVKTGDGQVVPVAVSWTVVALPSPLPSISLPSVNLPGL